MQRVDSVPFVNAADGHCQERALPFLSTLRSGLPERGVRVVTGTVECVHVPETQKQRLPPAATRGAALVRPGRCNGSGHEAWQLAGRAHSCKRQSCCHPGPPGRVTSRPEHPHEAGPRGRCWRRPSGTPARALLRRCLLQTHERARPHALCGPRQAVPSGSRSSQPDESQVEPELPRACHARAALQPPRSKEPGSPRRCDPS